MVAVAVGSVLFFVLTVAASSVYFYLFISSMLREPTREHLTRLLYLWQAQTAAAFALAAAFLGAALIIYQVGTGARQERDRRHRRFVAVRAVLSLDLSELIEYATTCAKIYAGLLKHPGPVIVSSGTRFPPLPAEVTARFAELIEAADANHAKPLISLVGRLQVQRARTRGAESNLAGGGEEKAYWRLAALAGLLLAAEIHAKCGKLLLNARSSANTPAGTISPDDVRASLWLIDPTLLDVPEVEAAIKGRTKIGPAGSTWDES
jgi:hypothetical protein